MESANAVCVKEEILEEDIEFEDTVTVTDGGDHNRLNITHTYKEECIKPELLGTIVEEKPACSYTDNQQIDRNELQFPCQICGKSFSFFGFLKHYENIHSSKLRFQCEICGKCYKRSARLKKHERIHLGSHPFRCETCGKAFRKPSGLKQHEVLHTDTLPLEPEVGKKLCKQSVTLKEDEKKHRGTPSSESCGQSVKHSLDLKVHEIIHSGTRPSPSEEAGQSFKQSAIHKQDESALAVSPMCEVCGKSFNHSVDVKTGKIDHADARSLPCEEDVKSLKHCTTLEQDERSRTDAPAPQVCRSFFKKSLSLKLDKKVNGSGRSFPCKVCRKCNKQSGIKEHKRFCTAPRPFPCKMCRRSFKWSSALEQHEITKHYSPRTLLSEVCVRCFKQSGVLKPHGKVHKGKHKIPCGLCGKFFKTFLGLKQHKMIHKVTPPLLCKVGEKSCKQSITPK